MLFMDVFLAYFLHLPNVLNDLTIAGHQFCVHYNCLTTPKTQQTYREGKGNANHERKGAEPNPTARVTSRVLQEPGQSESHLDLNMGVLETLTGTLQHFCQNTETTM